MTEYILETGQVYTLNAGRPGENTQEIEIVHIDDPEPGLVTYTLRELIPDHLLHLVPHGVTRANVGTDVTTPAMLIGILTERRAELLTDGPARHIDAQNGPRA